MMIMLKLTLGCCHSKHFSFSRNPFQCQSFFVDNKIANWKWKMKVVNRVFTLQWNQSLPIRMQRVLCNREIVTITFIRQHHHHIHHRLCDSRAFLLLLHRYELLNLDYSPYLSVWALSVTGHVHVFFFCLRICSQRSAEYKKRRWNIVFIVVAHHSRWIYNWSQPKTWTPV